MCAKSFSFLIIFIILSPPGWTKEKANNLINPPLPPMEMKHYRFTFADSWVGKDKADHFLVSAFLIAGSYYVLREEQNLSRYKAQSMSIGFTLSLGIAKEIRDGLQKNRAGSFQDIVADALGIATGILLFM